MFICQLSVRELCVFLIPLGELFQMMSLVPLQKKSISSLVRFIISFSATFVKTAIPAPGLTLLHSDLAVYPVICWRSLFHGYRLLKQSCVYFVYVFCPFTGWVRCCSLFTYFQVICCTRWLLHTARCLLIIAYLHGYYGRYYMLSSQFCFQASTSASCNNFWPFWFH